MQEGITVLFITHTREMGGANHSMLQLIDELASIHNVKSIVLLPKENKTGWDVEDECMKRSIQYISSRFYWFKSSSPTFKSFIKLLINIFLYIQILYKIRKLNFQIVHSNGSVIDLGAFISLFRHVKHVWHLREFGDLENVIPEWVYSMIVQDPFCMDYLYKQRFIQLEPLCEEEVCEILESYLKNVYPQFKYTEKELHLLMQTQKKMGLLNRPLFSMFLADAYANNQAPLNWDEERIWRAKKAVP